MWGSNMRVFCIVSYKGTNYFGWERQVEQVSIQGEIEKAISQLFNMSIIIYGSGRTDAGVHAYGQTFHFDVEESKYEEEELKYRLNCILPVDIKINSLRFLKDDEEFHSRYSAVSKEYQYRLSLNAKNPFRYEYAWLLKTNDFDVELFKEALSKFVGKHSFINFTSKEEDKDNYIREIYSINVGFDEENEEILVNFVGSGFMRYQIRFMIGTAVNVAMKKEELSYIDDKLNNTKERAIVPYKGQPQGLYLVKVNYK